jgi:hypothetical protein
MTNTSLLKVLLALSFTVSPIAASASPLILAQNGQPNATIVVQAKAPAPVQQAATDLQHYLQKISGVELALKMDGKDVAGITLNIGKTATAQKSDFPAADLNPETYAIHQRGDDVYFEGNYPSPTAFAVYSFLQDQLGVRWFAPGEDWEYVPQNRDKSTFTVDVKDVVSVPSTSPRIWSGHQWTQDWKDWDLHNKAVQSEKVLRRNFQNNMYRIFPPSKYAKAHPEYYPLINGKRWIPSSDTERKWWPCIGNKDVQRITAEYIHQWFTDHPDQDSFSLGMDDINQMCNDPLCSAMDASPDDYRRQNYSSRYYKFINIIAKQVQKSDPGKYIGVLIYRQVKQPPVDVPKMEDNVFGYIADGSVAQWFQPGFKGQWMTDTREWAKRVKHLSRYEYFGLGTFVPRVFPHAMNDEIKLDKSLGFEGMYGEMYTFLPQTAPMIWALAQLQWNPKLNIDDLLNEFYTKMYGPAAPSMKKYFDLMEQSWMTPRSGHNTGWVSWNIVRQATSISPEAVHEGMDFLDQAMAQAKTPLQKKRIDITRGGLQFASYAVLEFDLAQQLAAIPVTNAAQAEAARDKVQQLAALMQDRKTYWAAAEKRDDLLGANIRALSAFGGGMLQHDFSPLEKPAIAGILRVADWYQINQPDQAKQLTQTLIEKLPDDFLGDSLETSQWLAQAIQKHLTQLLKNGDFEDTSKNTAAPQEDWETTGAPTGWLLWNRLGSGKVTPAEGRMPKSKAVRLSALDAGETTLLLQAVPVQAGQKYAGHAWVKLEDLDFATGVDISFHFRTKDGWYTGKDAIHSTIAAINANWQKLMLAVTIPENVTSMTVMLSVSNTSATFDDVALYQLPS